MKISLRELRAVTGKLYDHLEASGMSDVDVPDVFYWSIPKEGRRDQYTEPKDFTVGQTSDDLAELHRIAAGEADPMGLGLVWLASILREIGEDHPG